MQDLTAFSIRPDVDKHGPLEWKFRWPLCSLNYGDWSGFDLCQWLLESSRLIRRISPTSGRTLRLGNLFHWGLECSHCWPIPLFLALRQLLSLNIFSHSLSFFRERKFLSNGSHQIKCLQLLELFKSLEKSLFMHENPFEMKLLLWQFVKCLKKAFNALTIKRSCYLRATKPVEKSEVFGFRQSLQSFKILIQRLILELALSDF